MITPENIKMLTITATIITMSLIYLFPLIYIIYGVVKRKDSYIWIAVAFAVPPIAALMYYLEKRRANASTNF